jgi:hypothetical protein
VGILATIILTSLSICFHQIDVKAFNISAFENDKDTTAMKEYLNFNAMYAKTYATQDEHMSRYLTFKKNYQLIMDHNKHAEIVPFTLELN